MHALSKVSFSDQIFFSCRSGFNEHLSCPGELSKIVNMWEILIQEQYHEYFGRIGMCAQKKLGKMARNGRKLDPCDKTIRRLCIRCARRGHSHVLKSLLRGKGSTKDLGKRYFPTNFSISGPTLQK